MINIKEPIDFHKVLDNRYKNAMSTYEYIIAYGHTVPSMIHSYIEHLKASSKGRRFIMFQAILQVVESKLDKILISKIIN